MINCAVQTELQKYDFFSDMAYMCVFKYISANVHLLYRKSVVFAPKDYSEITLRQTPSGTL